MHYLVFYVFFAEWFAHAVDEFAACFLFYIDQFSKLVKIQVHYESALILMNILAIHHFVQEFAFPGKVIFLIVSPRLLFLVIHKYIVVFERARRCGCCRWLYDSAKG